MSSQTGRKTSKVAVQARRSGLKPHQSLPPTTTVQQDTVTAGQRKINLIWESTQSVIALIAVLSMVIIEVRGSSSSVLNNIAFLIVGFYFARTNHTQIGGVGIKAGDDQPYVGR